MPTSPLAPPGPQPGSAVACSLPSLIVVAADNQRHIAEGLVSAGAAKLLPPEFSAEDLAGLLGSLLNGHAARTEMSRRAGRLCDGLGCARLTEAAIYRTTDRRGRAVSLRRAGARHMEMLLRWERARRDGIRSDARAPSDVEHAAWFASRIDDPACALQVIEVDEAAAGFLRADFSRDGAGYDVLTFVAEAFRGCGVATTALAIIRRMLSSIELRRCGANGAGFYSHARSAAHAISRKACARFAADRRRVDIECRRADRCERGLDRFVRLSAHHSRAPSLCYLKAA